ncbi:MAG: EamA family transporter [Actinomycetota bacterium]
MRSILVIIGAVTLATAGQLLLKSGMNQVGTIGGSQLSHPISLGIKVFSTPAVVAGFALFLGSSMFWLVALSRVPLSIAYPMVSVSYVLILAFSFAALHEHPKLISLGGAALIVIGVVLVGLGHTPQAGAK